MEISVQAVIQFLADHPLWAAFGTFAVAFAESLMIVSFAFPGMAIVVVAGALVSIGALIKRSGPYDGLLALTIIFLVALAIAGASAAVFRRRTPRPTCPGLRLSRSLPPLACICP